MSFHLDKIVPWGRSYAEYVDMFALTNQDLEQSILGCGDGPAGFNAVLTRAAGKVISVDPLYELDQSAIAQRIQETFPVVIEQTRLNLQQFVWHRIESVEALAEVRRKAMDEFLADYPVGLQQGRYRCESLPELSFPAQRFELAVCSHLLFLYGEQLSVDFHLAAIRELCRVALEVRIFPLLELGNKPSRHLPVVWQQLINEGYEVHLVAVAYEFQKGGNQMLVVKRKP